MQHKNWRSINKNKGEGYVKIKAKRVGKASSKAG